MQPIYDFEKSLDEVRSVARGFADNLSEEEKTISNHANVEFSNIEKSTCKYFDQLDDSDADIDDIQAKFENAIAAKYNDLFKRYAAIIREKKVF